MCTIAIKGIIYSIHGIIYGLQGRGQALLLAPVQYDVDIFIKNYYEEAKPVPLEELDFDVNILQRLVDDIHQSSDRFRAGRGYLCFAEGDAWVQSRQPYMPHWCK